MQSKGSLISSHFLPRANDQRAVEAAKAPSKLKIEAAERTEYCNEGIGSGRAATIMGEGSTAKDPEYDDIAAGAIGTQVGSKSV